MADSKDKTYISVKWIHAHPDCPILLVSELDNERMETRKIEYFKDGKVGLASRKKTTLKTFLGVVPVPTLAEINEDKEFQGVEISKADFDSQWDVYV